MYTAGADFSRLGDNYQNMIAAARQTDLGVMAIRVLSSGSLLGQPKPGSREERIATLAAEYGEPVLSFAIRFVLSKPGHQTTTEDVRAAIEEVTKPPVSARM
jgi:aryl-alcohol dehydrogenase-like predicted oxidoreductase